MTVAQEAAEFAADLTFERLPQAVVHAVRRHLLDALGCALAAAGAGAGSPVVDAVRAWSGAREAGIPGFDFRAPAPHAALATGTLIHALDYDDVHVESGVHAGTAVVPAALAAAEEAGVNGATAMAALAAGYEIATRAGCAAPRKDAGATGIGGAFGAAAAAGRAWGLTVDQMASALGIAGSHAGRLPVADGAETRRLQGGWAAQAGVIAADLARRGVAGPHAIFEATGFAENDGIVRDLGLAWETERMAIKPYPASRLIHAYVDAAARISVKAGDIDEVICFVAPGSVPVICEPRERKSAPASEYEAKFSLAFAVAAALSGGRGPIEMFGEEARTDRRLLALAERVRYDTSDAPPAPGARIRVHLRDGRVREAEEAVPRGHPDRPLSDDEVRSKFLVNVRGRLEQGAAQKLADEVWRLEKLDNLDELMALAQGL